MEKNIDKKYGTLIKVCLLALTSLLLLIPLSMVEGVIEDRKETKDAVVREVANSYAGHQRIYPPRLTSYVNEVRETVGIDNRKEKQICLEEYKRYSSRLDYKADVKTDVLLRSIYDVIVYNSHVQISGKFLVTDNEMRAKNIDFSLSVTDYKGFGNFSRLSFGGKSFELYRDSEYIKADVKLPEDAEIGDSIDFLLSFALKGTEALYFLPSGSGTTSLTISSIYAHPSFQGDVLPEHREVGDNGFEAMWSVSDFNSSISDFMGVKFVDPSNPYQQSMRSAKYGILIVVLVFVAGLFVEFLTRKEINVVQYVVIGLSLILFYSLLLSFSEFMTFGIAYTIAALMTTGALMFYFRAVLKSRFAYLLGGFVALVYALNYMLLQMETYALLAGSLVLFLLLCVVMYLTSNIDNNKLLKTE
ncbi:MAG: cell envelope integrity protein CreD [Bacteroidaceae bacterium]|nr:cell envelope integrity protein CreD [Bacteroidaceae bacterium]